MNANATSTSQRNRRRRPAAAVAASLALLVLLGACGGGGDGGRAADAQAPASSEAPAPAGAASGTPENLVTMQLIAFKPQMLTVDAGDTVIWEQKDAGVHTVTSGTVEPSAGGVGKVPDGRFDSGEIATGGTFTFTFGQPGTYSYFCSVHPATMRGEVRVR